MSKLGVTDKEMNSLIKELNQHDVVAFSNTELENESAFIDEVKKVIGQAFNEYEVKVKIRNQELEAEGWGKGPFGGPALTLNLVTGSVERSSFYTGMRSRQIAQKMSEREALLSRCDGMLAESDQLFRKNADGSFSHPLLEALGAIHKEMQPEEQAYPPADPELVRKHLEEQAQGGPALIRARKFLENINQATSRSEIICHLEDLFKGIRIFKGKGNWAEDGLKATVLRFLSERFEPLLPAVINPRKSDALLFLGRFAGIDVNTIVFEQSRPESPRLK